jgi:hypothetical protein
MTWQHWILVVGLITGGGLLFFILAKFGEKLVEKNNTILPTSSLKNLTGYDSKLSISDAA